MKVLVLLPLSAALILGASMAQAATAKKAPPKNASSAIVSNARTVALTGLTLTSAGGKNVATLKKPLAPGKKQSFKIAGKAGCLFSVNASFEDDAELEQSEVDLCLDSNIRLTD